MSDERAKAIATIEEDRLVSIHEAAIITGYTPATLANRRAKRLPPSYVKASPRCVRYKLSVLRKWVDERTVEPLAESA